MIHNLYELDNVPEQWDALIATVTVGDETERIRFSTDSSRLASCTEHKLQLWDATSGTPVKTFKGADITISDDFSVVTFLEDSTVTIRRVETDTLVAALPHSAMVNRIALSFDGARIAAGSSDGTVSLWDIGRGELIDSLGGYGGRQLEFSPNGYRLAYESSEGGIRLWDGAIGRIIANLDCDSERNSEFTFSRDGSRLASLTRRGRNYDEESNSDEDLNGSNKELNSNEDLNSEELNSDEGIEEGGYSLRLWNTDDGEPIGVAEGVGQSLAMSDDGSLIATGGGWKVKPSENWRRVDLSESEDIGVCRSLADNSQFRSEQRVNSF